MTALLQFDDVTFGYDRHPAVHHLSGVIMKGALIAVVGPNGAGKSTLCRGIMGLLKPFAGSIRREGLEASHIAYLPQSAEIDRTFPISVFDFVSMGLWRHIGMSGGMGAKKRDQVSTALRMVGLTGFERRPIGTLSGGQTQRMLFARLLLQDARMIVLDEPFNAVDSRTTGDLLALVHQWRDEGRTVLAALHDMDMVRAHFPETLLLARSLVGWGPTDKILTSDNLSAAQQMCEAFDNSAAACVADAPHAHSASHAA